MNHAISIKELTVVASGRTILSIPELTVEPGTLHGVIGPNGSGKSTLLRSVSGASSARVSGELRLDGLLKQNIPSNSYSQKVAWLPQGSFVPFAFSVLDIVLMGRFPWHRGSPSRHDVNRCLSTLEEFDCIHLQSRPMQELSGGERQRVLLCRALSGDHSILLLDEPEAFLDRKAVLYLFRWFKNQKTQKTVLISLHDLTAAIRHCNSLSVLKDGHLFHSCRSADLAETHLSNAFGVPAAILRLEGRQPLVDLE